MIGAKKGKDDYHGYCYICRADLKCDSGGKVPIVEALPKPKTQGSNAA